VIAVDMYSEKLINKVEAVGRVSAKQYDLCQQPLLDPKFVDAPLFTGLPACTGVVTGVVCLSSAAAINCKEPAILVTQETTPDDIEGMFCAHGILTMTGGATSHAAVVARGMNRPCVVGLSQSLSNFVEGETISICGATGRVWKGAVPVIDGSQSPHLLEFKNLLWSVSGATPIDSGAGDEVLVQASRYFHKPADFLTIVKSYAQDTKVYVDCRTAWGSAEREFFGDFVADHAKAENHAVCNLLKYSTKDWSAAMVANVVLITFEEQKTFKSMRVVQTLEDMIMAEGEVIWDVTAVHTEAAKKVMQWQEGKVKPVTIGQSTSHDANSKTFLTEAQVVVGYLK
jgi:phosphohistidine swiveling domain-containing protein